jgi:hypothetical protein
MKDASILKYETVNKEDNRKIMLGAERIAHSEDGVEVWQSENRNVITIIHNNKYHHVLLQDIVDAVLCPEAKELLGHKL